MRGSVHAKEELGEYDWLPSTTPTASFEHCYLEIFVSSHWSMSQTNKKSAGAATKPLVRHLRRQRRYKKKRGEKMSLLSCRKLSPPSPHRGTSDKQAMLCDVAPLDPPTHTHTRPHAHAHAHAHTCINTHTILHGEYSIS